MKFQVQSPWVRCRLPVAVCLCGLACQGADVDRGDSDQGITPRPTLPTSCKWPEGGEVIFSDLRVVEGSGDYTGLEIVLRRRGREWRGRWGFGEGGLSDWYPVDSLTFNDTTGATTFVLPAAEGNLPMTFDGTVTCDALNATQSFGRVSRVRTLPHRDSS